MIRSMFHGVGMCYVTRIQPASGDFRVVIYTRLVPAPYLMAAICLDDTSF